MHGNKYGITSITLIRLNRELLNEFIENESRKTSPTSFGTGNTNSMTDTIIIIYIMEHWLEGSRHFDKLGGIAN